MIRDESRRLTRLEVAAQRCLGEDPTVPPLAVGAAAKSPVAALEDVLRSALAHPPCLIAFSGGRDSSALLAVAARLALREGLPAPIPATLRLAGAPLADESAWQEMVVEHLALEDWLRIPLTDELDFVGPTARRLLGRHGLLWPPNLHFFAPLLAAARGGSLVSGVEGDAVLAAGFEDLVGQTRLRTAPRRGVGAAYRTLPLSARRHYRAWRLRREAPWLRARAIQELASTMLALRPVPRALDARLDHLRRQRSVVLRLDGLGLMAADERVRFVHPFAESGFLASLAGFLGKRGVGGRTALMQALFGDLLPDAVLTRDTKATFSEAFCGPSTVGFVRTWDGTGVELDLVDPDALRSYWGDGTAHRPLGLTALLMQAACIANDARGSDSFRLRTVHT
jgi:asparagine synthase (glutamine-hydrolysing)